MSNFDPTTLEYTPKEKSLSVSDTNRNYLSQFLPEGTPEHGAMSLFNIFQSASKLHGSYVFPRLYHRSNKKTDQNARAIPHGPYGLVHPNWYAFPGPVKDGGGAEGGTIQSRVTCKGPAIQTDPKAIQKCITSRYDGGYIIWDDLSQAELWCGYLCSGDEKLGHDLRTGSIHVNRARYLFGDSFVDSFGDVEAFKEEAPRHYLAAKTTVFAGVYLSAARTMYESVVQEIGLDLPLALFERLVADRPILHPDFYAWQMELIEAAARDKIITLPVTGHSRYFSGPSEVIKAEHASAIVDFPLQTVAATILLDAQSHLRPLLPSALDPNAHIRQIAQIYDAIVLDVHPDYLDNAKELLDMAYDECYRTGYHAQMRAHYGTELPIKRETKILGPFPHD